MPDILQQGLTCSSDEQMKEFAERVNKFNLANLTTPVKLDIVPFPEGSIAKPEPHYGVRLLFSSKELMRRFWTGEGQAPSGLILPS